MPGPRSALENSATHSSTTPTSSQVTPMLLITDIARTPTALITVVTASTPLPSRTAFAVGLSRTWKPLQIAGSTICIAIAAAATVTTCATSISQPAVQPHNAPPRREAHWEMQPEIGERGASSEKHSATSSWPTKTSGQVQKNDGPPKPKPKLNSWKTVVRMEAKGDPAGDGPWV